MGTCNPARTAITAMTALAATTPSTRFHTRRAGLAAARTLAPSHLRRTA